MDAIRLTKERGGSYIVSKAPKFSTRRQVSMFSSFPNHTSQRQPRSVKHASAKSITFQRSVRYFNTIDQIISSAVTQLSLEKQYIRPLRISNPKKDEKENQFPKRLRDAPEFLLASFANRFYDNIDKLDDHLASFYATYYNL